ncbi:uncharacterized protein FA14DRAFT_161818 [Meira miltonrushii]|uniref:Uncharacterized protein n=1 Tax=Meira miltonrushii TaxID=1280837 RepID=A0A316VA38_9BASI|nr:uncharacterized protein FA14DRAFT_161818 [Meira miltonrushii]PWN34437.1 hypothetical protein FA14DRAFT_161818 [Meira miltonrushii]
MSKITGSSSGAGGSQTIDQAKGANPQNGSIKGPPLGSSSHTLQLLVMLTLNSILIFLCLIVLPAHMLWREASKQNLALKNNEDSITVSPLAKQAYDSSLENVNSARQNLITAFKLLFSTPNSDSTAIKWIKRGNRSTLAALILSQSWFVARFKGWWDEAEAMERGDREEVMKRRRIGIGKQMEHVTMTSFVLPLIAIVIYAVLVLCGAPFLKSHLDTLFLSGFLALLALLPAIHVLGTDEQEWIKAFSFSSTISETTKAAPRFKILVRTTTCTLLGALIGSSGVLLDWDKAWQAYPVPSVLGASIGLLVGNVLAGLTYLMSTQSRSAGPRVERKGGSILSTASKKKKKR